MKRYGIPGVLSRPPMPNEPLPGAPGWVPPFNVPHAPTEYSRWPAAQQGTPRRHNIRRGVRSATPEPTPPPAFAFLLANVGKIAQGGVGAKVLVAQTQAPIGVIH